MKRISEIADSIWLIPIADEEVGSNGVPQGSTARALNDVKPRATQQVRPLPHHRDVLPTGQRRTVGQAQQRVIQLPVARNDPDESTVGASLWPSRW